MLYPHLWVVDSTGVPVPQDDQIVSFSFLAEIRKARNKPYLLVSNLKVKPRGFTILKTIGVVDVMLGKLQSEPFIKSFYTINDPKYVKGTLVGTDLKMA